MNTNTENTIKAVVSHKPYPVLIEMRPAWRISLILICIEVVAGDKKYLDIDKVNILVWMLIRRKKWEGYEDFLLDRTKSPPLISIDSATFKATEYALAKGVLTMEKGRLYLTPNSERVLSLLHENEIMTDEIDFLERLGKKLTEKKIKALTGRL